MIGNEITYPDGTTVDRAYTDRGQLEEVEYESADVATFVYDDGGRETSRTFGNSLVTTTGYITGENLIDTLTNTAVGNYSYSYDANDNKTAETITGVMSGYRFTTPSGYDDENRLVAWERDDAGLDLSWTLSDVGNWDSDTENTVTQNRRAGAVHELTAIDGCHRPLLIPLSPGAA